MDVIFFLMININSIFARSLLFVYLLFSINQSNQFWRYIKSNSTKFLLLKVNNNLKRKQNWKSLCNFDVFNIDLYI